MFPKNTFITKSRFIVALSVSLFFLGIYSLVYIQSSYTDKLIEDHIEKAEYDLTFFSRLIKKAYLNNDFVEIENILGDWTRSNKLDHTVNVVASNGFELFSWTNDLPAPHTKRLEQKIVNEGRLLMTISLERDLSTVLSEAERKKQEYLLMGLAFAGIFGVLIWFLLDKFAFSPLEKEIKHRHIAEGDLLRINDELETRVEERTSAIKKLSGVVQQTDDIVVITDPHGIVEYVNPAFEKITGYSSEEVVGNDLGAINSGLHENKFYETLWRTINAGKSFRDVFINRKKNGDIYYEEKTITPLKDSNEQIQNYVSTGKDISDRIEIQEKLHYMATHDALTELPNRLMVIDRLKHAIQQAERSPSMIAVIFIDLDRFKQVNDSLGHPAGDSLLKVIAEKLKTHLRKGDTLGRLGGDEFTILMEGIHHIDDVIVVVQKMLEAVSEPVLIGGYEIISSASMGITLFPDDASDVDTLLKNADVAMYRAKSQGGNTFQFYTHDMSVQADERMKLHHSLNHALERDEFKLFYQPKVNVHTGKVVGMEALLRWDHPEMGLLGPLKFIPILEESGKIVEVGNWVFHKACAFNAKLQRKGFKHLRVSVNLSARQFQDENLVQCIEDICTKQKLDTSNLEIEITESLLVENVETAVTVLDKLHHAGVHIAVDDFGTGYSSMSYLKRFPIDTLKVDKSFVEDIPDDKEDVAIVRAIVALADSLGLNLVAEGVETAAQLQFFTEVEQCDVQGFYISKPKPEEEFIAWMTEYNNNIEGSAVFR
jgi:diguanylate cyclase (GGDEF)-like protein/PAS domain S-box-containing protein